MCVLLPDVLRILCNAAALAFGVAKTFAGPDCGACGRSRGLTQVALARAVDLSTSYVNQLENDQRPLTVPVLLTLAERFDLPTHYFAPDSDARLVADLREILPTPAPNSGHADAQIEELVARMPGVGQIWSPASPIA